MLRKAFTLIELAIVLVIISFLAVASLSTGTIIDNMKVKKVITEVEELRNAVDKFTDIYTVLPGDMSNSTLANFPEFGNVSNPANDTTGMTAACVGDEYIASGVFSSNIGSILALKQMSLVKLLPIILTSTIPSTFNEAAQATNIVIGKDVLGSYMPDNYYHFSVASLEGQYKVVNYITLDSIRGYAMTPKMAQMIDQKLDDGNPFTGGVVSMGDLGKVPVATGVTPVTTTNCVESNAGTPIANAASVSSPFENNYQGYRYRTVNVASKACQMHFVVFPADRFLPSIGVSGNYCS